MLRFVVDNFKEELKKMLGLLPSTIKLTWEKGFEEFLTTRKKRRKVLDPETLTYYRNLFKKYLEGKVLTYELVNYVVNHENEWLRNVLRHYAQYLYYKRAIPPETYGWLMEVAPSRSYKMDVRPYPINLQRPTPYLTYFSKFIRYVVTTPVEELCPAAFSSNLLQRPRFSPFQPPRSFSPLCLLGSRSPPRPSRTPCSRQSSPLAHG